MYSKSKLDKLKEAALFIVYADEKVGVSNTNANSITTQT
jgi:hypothetical protein